MYMSEQTPQTTAGYLQQVLSKVKPTIVVNVRVPVLELERFALHHTQMCNHFTHLLNYVFFSLSLFFSFTP